MDRACKAFLEQIIQKKKNSIAINMSKRKPLYEKHHMLPHYIGDYEPKQKKIDFESVRKILMN